MMCRRWGSISVSLTMPKVNQSIYTLDTICDPNSMTMAQAVLEIFRSKASIGL